MSKQTQNNPAMIQNLSRRNFIQGSLGLTLGIWLPTKTALAAEAGQAHAEGFVPNAFLRIATDDTVTVISKHLEMGQGTYTGLATLLAEELDADWAKVRVEAAPADAKRYNNLLWGPAQGTGGSTAIANSWQQLRKAGASARAMLVAAAAQRWQVAAGEITVSQGVLRHAGTNQSLRFGQLAAAAAGIAVPAEVALKQPQDFKLIGKTIPRKDSQEKTNGTAIFTQDIQLPGMLVAVVAHPPRFGGKPKSFDASASLKIKGVRDVVQIASGVAVLADDIWSAKKGRDALVVEWDESQAMHLGSDALMQRYRQMAQQAGMPATNKGDADKLLAESDQLIAAEYEFPYLAHAAMEPMNCVIQWHEDACEAWYGAQMHTGDQFALASVFGLLPEQVTIHTLYAGGSFGRRASKLSDYVLEAAHIVKAIDGRAPVKLVWLREDDMRAGFYRPMFYHALSAALDQQGNITAWRQRLVGQSIAAGSPFEKVLVKDGIDKLSVEGAANLPYAIDNLRVELHTPTDVAVPVLWWRSVGSTHTAFSTETFIDELAVKAGQDPYQMRLKLLANHPRHAAVLKLAAEQAGWDKPLAQNGGRRGRGIAVHESFQSFVAEVAEVSIAADGSVKVDRVVCAVDCGMPINPDVIRAQLEGSIGYALSALYYGEISLKDGMVEQGNFDSYMAIRINEMPQVEVHIVPSAEPPTGIGEPGVPPLAPAVVNAIAAATGKRLRRLPIRHADLSA